MPAVLGNRPSLALKKTCSHTAKNKTSNVGHIRNPTGLNICDGSDVHKLRMWDQPACMNMAVRIVIQP